MCGISRVTSTNVPDLAPSWREASDLGGGPLHFEKEKQDATGIMHILYICVNTHSETYVYTHDVFKYSPIDA